MQLHHHVQEAAESAVATVVVAAVATVFEVLDFALVPADLVAAAAAETTLHWAVAIESLCLVG